MAKVTSEWINTIDLSRRPGPFQEESKMRIEEWKSSEGRTEIHYFRAEDDEYLFGYNPLIMPTNLLRDLLDWANAIH